MTRTSLLLLYHRIFGIVKGFRWALGVSGFLVIGYFIACVTVSIAGCSPVAKFWHTSLPGHCIDEVAFFRWNGVANMFLDFLVLLLPLPMVWRVNTTRRQKWILTGIFLLGGFVCVVSIIRVVNFDGSSFADPTYESVGPVTWSSVEQSVAIICACLPTFRPLFRVLYGPSKSTSDSNNSSLANSQDHASSPRLMSQCDEDSSIIAIVQSPLSRQEMRGAHVHRSDVTDSTRSPTSMFKDDERPESQGSQADRPVSAEKSST
ncbi:hypothetical protein N7461_003746 [Penicillium sp. DV-2018c]|nr:hypothetical protein N7461_003746 [Penicillium sp. DV-2018c]